MVLDYRQAQISSSIINIHTNLTYHFTSSDKNSQEDGEGLVGQKMI